MNKFLSEFIYGSIDGLITTFVIISSSIGASIPNMYIIIISIASLLSDGYSMGISRYLSYSAELKKNIKTTSKNPLISGIYTFLSFILIGILPILPFLFVEKNIFEISLFITLLLFVIIGIIKGIVLKDGIIKSSIETLLLGSSASFMGYFIGYYLKNYLKNKD